jgi:hypothetical protein
LTANTASESKYGPPATKMCVVTGAYPGASAMKWMCAGRKYGRLPLLQGRIDLPYGRVNVPYEGG